MNGNLAYQDAFREELINGELVAMSPAATNHNRIARNISRIFGNYLLWKDCEPFGDGEAVFLSEEDRFIPDFMVVRDAEKIKWNGVHGAPDLVVEVLSPGTAKNDRGRKKDVYEKYIAPKIEMQKDTAETEAATENGNRRLWSPGNYGTMGEPERRRMNGEYDLARAGRNAASVL